jgi:hypothetical protein
LVPTLYLGCYVHDLLHFGSLAEGISMDRDGKGFVRS